MKKRTTVLIALLVILIVVYAVIQLTDGSGRSKSFREYLVEIDTGKVTRVEIYGPEASAVLLEDENGWNVVIEEDLKKPAKESSVKSLLNTLKSVKPSRLAARSEDKWKDFQVDSAGTRVVVYEGDDEALDLILGRFGVEGQRSFYTYVRLNDEADTYVANDFMKMSVSFKPDDYRNNQVLQLKKDSLTSIDFNYPDSSFTLTKEETKWRIGNEPADSANVAKYLNGLSFVTSKEFAEPAGSASVYDVVFHFTDQEDIQISVSENNVIQSSANQAEAFEDEGVREKIFKGPGYFKGE